MERLDLPLYVLLYILLSFQLLWDIHCLSMASFGSLETSYDIIDAHVGHLVCRQKSIWIIHLDLLLERQRIDMSQG